MYRRLSLILFAIGMVLFWFDSSQAAENMPFQPGEKLYFRVYWTVVQAGEFTLEVLPMENLDNKPVYHFVMTAATFPFIDLFYKVRDRVESYTDQDMSHALLYKEKKEGKRSKKVSITYDWEKLQAQYIEDGKKRKSVALQPGAFDPLSIFYFFRMQDLKENLEITRPVSDGKDCIMGKAYVIKKEKVKVAGGLFDTYLVEPQMEQIGGVFQKSPGAKLQIWVTADERRIPVKIKSQVAVGSFSAELDSMENPK
jgi:hypothetical protein